MKWLLITIFIFPIENTKNEKFPAIVENGLEYSVSPGGRNKGKKDSHRLTDKNNNLKHL